MSLESGLQNIWSSDYVQKNPNKAYKASYATEYAAVAAYLAGGAEPNFSGYSKMGKGLCEVEKERRAAVVVPPDPVPPDPPSDAYFVSDWDTVNNGQMKWEPWATLFQVGSPSTIDLGLYGGPGISAAPNGRAAVVANPYGVGKVLRLEIRNSDPPTGANTFQKEELGSYEPATWPGGAWVDGVVVWILMEMYFPDEFGLASGGPNSFTNIADMHPSSSSGIPALGLGGYSTTNLQLYCGFSPNTQRRDFIPLTAGNRNRKLSVVIGAKMATSGGWVEAWLDGVNTIPRFSVVTAEPSESGPYWKQGLYKEKASSFPNGGCVIYFGRTLLSKTRPF